ncbi:hypothetical protein GCM10010252_77390 [Streptomyces aureoverticillatus]|nr:hypothetical protein GCM10010252_77390 [Streptomyces aureoverticillatus]
MARQTRPDRTTLPGIADIRITANKATTDLVLDVLPREFITTAPRP